MGNFCGFRFFAWFWKDKSKQKPAANEIGNEAASGNKTTPLLDDKNGARKFRENYDEKRLEILDELKARNNNCDDIIIGFEKKFAEEVLSRKVILEDIFISGRDVSILIAISSCDELPPKVTVRYTTDSWKTESDEEATPFSTDENNNKTIQRFFFMMSVPLDKSLEFVVKSTGGSGIFWDNNNKTNYRIDDAKENEDPPRIMARFTPLKQAMLSEVIKIMGVVLKSASLKDGKITLTIVTKEKPIHQPVVHYTLDEWKSFQDASSVGCKGTERDLNVSEIHLDAPKQVKMKFAICWRHEGRELWDNNDGKNFEIQG